MKKLQVNITPISAVKSATKKSARKNIILKKISHCFCLLMALSAVWALNVQPVLAQTNNQISYPVKLQVEQAAVSSVAPVAEPKAPEPVIRPVDQASTLPPASTAKKSSKAKTKVVDADEEPKAKKTSKKKVAEKNPVAVKAEKPAAQKTVTKTVAAKTTATKATTSEKKNAEKPQVVAAVATTATVAVVTAASLNEQPAVTVTQKNISTLPADNVIHDPATHVADSARPVDSATQAAVARILDEAPADDENFETSESAEPVAKTNNPAPAVHTQSPLVVNGYKEEFVKEFEEFVETKIAPTVPGAALAIIADGRVKVLQAYGIKRSGGRDPVDTDTLFRLASVSKTIGSSAAAKLVQDGLVSWDTTINSVLPDVEFSNPRYGNQLTIRHILSQASGLPTHTNDNFIEEGMSFDEVVRRLRYVNFICPPGKCYTYQNVAYSLISPIILKKTGKTYEQYATEKLFKPLGMRTASFGLDGLKSTNNYTLPHTRTRGGWTVETVNENYYHVNPAAGVNASITDMSRWVLAHMGHNPEVLPPAMLKTLHDKVTRSNYYGARDGVTDIHYGLGWRTFDYRGDKNFVHHGGAVLGFRSEVVFNPELQIGMVMLSNCNRLPGSIIFKFLDTYEDHKQGKKPVAAPLIPVKKSKK